MPHNPAQHIKYFGCYPFLKSFGLWIFLCFFNFSYAQIQTQLNPESIMIGDTTSLQYTVTVDSEKSIELPVLGDSLSHYLEIANIQTDTLQRGRNLSIVQNITLTGFEPGEFLVKGLPIKIDGETLMTKSFTLFIKDVEVDESRQGIFPIKPIMTQDISWWEKNQKYIYYIIAGLVMLLIILLIIWLYFKEKKKQKYVSTPLLPPYEEALENLKKLDKQQYLAQEKFYEFYSDLSFIVRRYFQRRFDFPAMALLSTDLAEVMHLKEYLTGQESKKLAAFLEDADFTKYARQIPSPDKHSMYRNWIEEIIHKTRPVLDQTLLEEGSIIDESDKIRKIDEF